MINRVYPTYAFTSLCWDAYFCNFFYYTDSLEYKFFSVPLSYAYFIECYFESMITVVRSAPSPKWAPFGRQWMVITWHLKSRALLIKEKSARRRCQTVVVCQKVRVLKKFLIDLMSWNFWESYAMYRIVNLNSLLNEIFLKFRCHC